MEIILLVPLLFMIYWDFRTRQILLWQLLLFGIMQSGICVYKYGIVVTGYYTLANTVILLIIAAAVGTYSYFRFKGKKRPIGWGDILFIFLLTPYFPHRSFLYFLIISFSLTLIGWLIWSHWKKTKSGNIPLVSGIGICYACILIYHSVCKL